MNSVFSFRNFSPSSVRENRFWGLDIAGSILMCLLLGDGAGFHISCTFIGGNDDSFWRDFEIL